MRILLCLLFLFSYSQFFGQERSEVIQQRIEFISEQLQSEDLDLTNFIEQLNYYYDNPININATTGEDLDELNLLIEKEHLEPHKFWQITQKRTSIPTLTHYATKFPFSSLPLEFRSIFKSNGIVELPFSTNKALKENMANYTGEVIRYGKLFEIIDCFEQKLHPMDGPLSISLL